MSVVAVAPLVLLLAGAAPRAAPQPDPRSTVLVDLTCRSRIARRELTLFANGTVRLREQSGDEPRRMRLGELGPAELTAYLNRLRAEDLGETDGRSEAPSGDWTESCTLALDLPDLPARTIRFDHYASLSLALSHVVAILDDLAAEVSPEEMGRHLPAGYEPRAGDLLRRVDGALFEVVGPTADGHGVELRGVDQPLTLLVPKDLLARTFVALERPGSS